VSAALGYVGSGYDSAGVVTPIVTFVVPNGVTTDYDGLFVLAWSVQTGSEVAPAVAPLGSGWSTIVAPVTSGLSIGWAVFQRDGGLKAGDVVAFQIPSGGRAAMGTDLYLARAGTAVAGAVTPRAGTSGVTTAAAMATTEAAQLVLALSVERTAGTGTVVNSVSGMTVVDYRESSTNGNLSILVGAVPAPAAAGSTAVATATYSVTSSSGGAAQVAIPTASALAAPDAGLLYPSNELVAVAWLKDAVTYLGSRVATELPADNSTWGASGFTTVQATGGTPHLYVPERKPVVSIDTWGVSGKAGRPPWNLASQQAERIREACLDHLTVARKVTMPSGYRSARVVAAIPRTEPRRMRGDAASYAHYQQDVEFWWVMGP
jgi:hypothetical protein